MTAPPPLTGVRVLELAGLAPGPFAGLLLADHGASVLRIDRPIPSSSSSTSPQPRPQRTPDLLTRHKSSIPLNLKSPSSHALLLSLIPHTDILIDPFRPSILTSLHLSPSSLLALNPRLIIARMTGFRRDGKYKDMAGHDINYIAVSGALSLFGRKGEKPYAPGNVLGDFAGGGAVLFMGILLALVERQRTGRGGVVEANMVDGSAYLVGFPRLHKGLGEHGLWGKERGENVLDGGCPWYDTYETSEPGKYMAVGALEPQFFAELIKGLGLQGRGIEESRQDRRTWPKLKALFEETFKSKSRAQWEQIFDGTDACVTPVLDFDELRNDPSREGDVRPIVTLREAPAFAISERRKSGDGVQGEEGKEEGGGRDGERDPAEGQGEGVDGEGYVAKGLYPGEGGESTLQEWMGWKNGRDYEMVGGALVLKERGKL